MTGDHQGFRAAGVRLTEEQLPHLRSHRTELLGDSLPAIHAFDKAHAVMLTEQGLLDPAAGRAILGALRGMEEHGVAQARIEAGGGMHSGEQYLIATLGPDLGGRLHLGRSSGDLIEVARRMTIRWHLHAMLPALAELRAVLLGLADVHAETVMPGYTHGQHAQPTTFGHWATMFEQAFARDTERLLGFHRRLNRSPAGAAIFTGSDLPLDRHRVAGLLGFDDPLPHTMDAILSHDLEMEAAALLATIGATLARLADDLYLWSTSEFGYVELPDRFCGTSSIMPQKKNPDALEDVKSVATQALAALVGVVTAERGPTGFPILERRYSQQAIWSMCAAITAKLADAGQILTDLRVDRDRMAAQAGAHWAQVTDVASALVRHTGLDWRHAHQVVGVFVRLGVERGLTPPAAPLALLDEAAAGLLGRPSGLTGEQFADAMDPRAFVRRRTLHGGPAAEAVRRESAGFAERLAADRRLISELRHRVAGAEDDLETALDTIIGAVPAESGPDAAGPTGAGPTGAGPR
ncbi:argininosuccinate lyase [Solwaraspora sp. WMMB335]|uniref:argininosuccinate lyase n=1 Tax=Solwaraspora sp. WMMB335 TaxID=3404118 RepID=UPI003B94D554